MSALPQSDSFYRQPNRLSELEALQQIGRIAQTAVSAPKGLHAIAEAALWIPGVLSVNVEEGVPLTARNNSHTTLVTIEANGRSWGRLLLTTTGDAPRSASFLAQQVALLFNRLDLIRRRDALRAQAKRLSERLETRKNLHRAAGLVARARGVSDHAALRILVSHARKSRRSLNRVAETVLLGYEAPLTRRPALRRLQPHEFTRASG
jgi:ANTAR domain